MREFAVYAGSFDPPTRGHQWMIEQGARLFERLVIAVGVNPDKSPTYPRELRLQWLAEIARPWPNVEVSSCGHEFLVRYAERIGAGFILRGIRNESDYAYERAMRNVNADLTNRITTVFLMPPREMAEVSSSLVKGMIGPAGWREVVRAYVPACVFEYLDREHV